MYSYEFGGVSAAKFGAFAALGLIAFAYVGGITMISGRLLRRPDLDLGPRLRTRSTSGSASPATGRCSSRGVALIVTLIMNPEGVAGANYKKAAAAAPTTTGGPGRGRRCPRRRRERRRIVPQPVRDRDSARLRGLGGDVPVLRAVRRAQARAGRAALLVLELDALPAADAGVRPGLRGRPVHGDRRRGRTACSPSRRPWASTTASSTATSTSPATRSPTRRRSPSARSSSRSARATTSRTGTSCTRSGRRRWRR